MARLDSVDALALLFLFVIVLALCVVSSCIEDKADSNGMLALAEKTPPTSPRRRALSRARERSPIWRSQQAEVARQEEL